MHRFASLLACAVLLAALGCGGSSDDSRSKTGKVATIEIVPASKLVVGEDYDLRVVGHDDTGAEIKLPAKDVILTFEDTMGTRLVGTHEDVFRLRTLTLINQIFHAKYKLEPKIKADVAQRQFGVYTGVWTISYLIGDTPWTTTMSLSQFGNDVVGTSESKGGTLRIVENVGATVDTTGTKGLIVSQGFTFGASDAGTTTLFDSTYTNVESPRLTGGLRLPKTAIGAPNAILTLVNR